MTPSTKLLCLWGQESLRCDPFPVSRAQFLADRIEFLSQVHYTKKVPNFRGARTEGDLSLLSPQPQILLYVLDLSLVAARFQEK